jgi:hypothetical protein
MVETYCDVFDWRSSLLGNRSHNSSMDTLTTPVLLRYMVTNSRKANVSYRCVMWKPTVGKPVFPLLLAVLRKGSQYTESVYAGRPPKLVYVS